MNAASSTPPPLRFVSYLRVSTREQLDTGVGIDAQRRRIQAEAENRPWHHVSEYVDGESSGKSMDGRPALASALRALEDGCADALVAARLDRISRSVHDFSGLLARAKKDGWGIVALDVGVDMTTISGRLIANVMATVAEYEREIIGQRTADALAALRQQGVTLGRPSVLPDPLIVQVVAERRNGATLLAIAERLNSENVPTAHGGGQWWPSTISGLLRSQAAAALSEEGNR